MSFANENLPKETLPTSRPKPVFKAPFKPFVNVLPGDLRGVLGVNPSSTAFKQKMSGYIAGFLIEASNVVPKVIIKNEDAVSRQRFKLYVYLLVDELKKALLKSDDPNVRAYANSLRYPDEALIDAAFTALGSEDGSSWNPFNNPYQAANMIVNSFIDSLPIDVYREEKIDAVTVSLSEKVKNAFNALVPILNSCTETVATGQTTYCTAQAALVMEIRNILISQGKDVSKTLLSFENGLYAEEADIASIFAGFGGSTTNPTPVNYPTNNPQYVITYTPSTPTTSASFSFKNGASDMVVVNEVIKNVVLGETPQKPGLNADGVTIPEDFKFGDSPQNTIVNDPLFTKSNSELIAKFENMIEYVSTEP